MKVLQGFRVEGNSTFPAGFGLCDEACFFQDPEVFGDGLHGHAVGKGQLADGGLSEGEALENGSSRGIGQGVE